MVVCAANCCLPLMMRLAVGGVTVTDPGGVATESVRKPSIVEFAVLLSSSTYCEPALTANWNPIWCTNESERTVCVWYTIQYVDVR